MNRLLAGAVSRAATAGHLAAPTGAATATTGASRTVTRALSSKSAAASSGASVFRGSLSSGTTSSRLSASGGAANSSLATRTASTSSLSPASSSHRYLSPQAASKALSIAASTSPLSVSKSSSASSSSRRVHITPSLAAAAAAPSGVSPSTVASGGAPIPSSALVQVSTLDNGVRVATEATPGHFSATGIYIDAGSRYERPWVEGESGVSHLIDRMAFKSTKSRSSEQMISEIEALGGNVMCSSARETIMYQSSFFHKDFHKVLSILSDTILNPKLSEEELAIQKEAARYEIGEITAKAEMNLPELIHTVAYQDNTLGNPLLCPLESLEKMTSKNLRDFMDTWYTPERIVVAGAGMPHEALVKETEKLFGGMKSRSSIKPALQASSRSSSPSSSSSSSSSRSSIFSSPSSSTSSPASSAYGSADFSTTASRLASPVDSDASPYDQALAQARYTGGEAYLDQPDSEFTHVYVAFEGVSIHDDDIYALATLQVLLGGGGSFSAGGPGKGMYSRLYSNVLNQYHAVDHCSAFHHCYNDSGLFGIAASVHPSFNSSIGHVIARELNLCTMPNRYGGITGAELMRARNQLKSSLVMALESRMVEVEDLGRQVLVHGKKVSVEEMCEKIDQVDLKTLHRVATRIFKGDNAVIRDSLNHGHGNGQATVVCQGQLEGLQDLRLLLYHQGLGVDPRKKA